MIDKNTIYSYFQTDDFPTEEQFRATWDSFWHKSESIPMSSISGLNQLFQQTATVAQLNNKANVDGSNIDVSAYQEKLNITNLIATAKEEVKTELLNGAPEAFDTLKEISDWISDDETAEAAILQAIQNEATARTEADNQKLDKGNYIGTAQDLYNYFEGKIDAGYNCIPVVGNGASGKVLTDSVVSQIYGKVGINLPGEASEKLEIGGNIKAIDFKGQSIKFNLQASITPTPNTLVPKTDGSGLIWYDNSSIAKNMAIIPSEWSFGFGGVATSDNYDVTIGTRSKLSVTSSYQSVSIGADTIRNGTSYKSNAIGYGALEYGGGSYNNAFGVESIGNSSTSQRCTAIGESALYCGGTDNIAIGYRAGMPPFISDKGATSLQNIYLGGLSLTGRVLGDTVNQINIGYNVVGKGSNTIEFGNDNIISTYLKGKIILNERLKLASYTKAQRNALTSKTVGEMIWQTDSGNSGIRVYDGTNWLAIQTIID